MSTSGTIAFGAPSFDEVPYARIELVHQEIGSLGGSAASLADITMGVTAGTVASLPFTSARKLKGGMTWNGIDGWSDNNAASQVITTSDTQMGIVIPKSGTYRFDGFLPNSDDATVQTDDRPYPVICVNGVPDSSYYTDNNTSSNNNVDQMHFSGTVDLSEGDVVQVGVAIEGGEEEAFDFGANWPGAGIAGRMVISWFELMYIDQETVVQNEAADYSTAERKTNRKWIDGKDIYERVFEFTSAGTSADHDIDTSIDYETLVCIKGYVMNNANQKVPLPNIYWATGDYFIPMIDGTDLIYRLAGSRWANREVKLIVEYTKV